MKQYITIAALFAAGAAIAPAAESVLLFSDAASGGGTYLSIGSTNLSGINSSSTAVTISASDLSATFLNSVSASGWYLGTGTGASLGTNFTATDWALSSSDGTATFKTNTRPAYKSQYVAFVYDLSDLSLSGTYAESDSLDVSLSYTTSANSAAQITLWYVDASNSVSSLATGAAADAGATICGSLDYTTEGRIVALFSNSSTSVATTYSNVSLTATIPEPSAFGLLAGAGALALVASRRRRK